MTHSSIVVFIFAILTFATANTPESKGLEVSADGNPSSALEVSKLNSSSNVNLTKSVPIPKSETSPAKAPLKDDAPLKAECTSHRDCPYNHCCTVGMMRFTFPSCSPMSSIDDPCMPTAESKNYSLTYPNLKTINVKEAYILFCPCGSGLVCDRNSATCQLPSEKNMNKEHGNANDLAE